MHGSASSSLLSDLPACLKSSLIELIHSLAACGMFLYVSEGDEFAQRPIGIYAIHTYLDKVVDRN